MPNQTQPHKELLKTWSNWESGIGFLPGGIDEEGATNGMYFSDGVVGIHGELRPAPYFRESSLHTHMIRRCWPQANSKEGAALILQLPGAVVEVLSCDACAAERRCFFFDCAAEHITGCLHPPDGISTLRAYIFLGPSCAITIDPVVVMP